MLLQGLLGGLRVILNNHSVLSAPAGVVFGLFHAATAQILGSPVIALIMLLFIISVCTHMRIGMQVVIEDYVHGEKTKLACVMANNFFCIAVALASIYAILKISSGV